MKTVSQESKPPVSAAPEDPEEVWELGTVTDQFKPWHIFTFVMTGERQVYVPRPIFEGCVGLRAGAQVLLQVELGSKGAHATAIKLARKSA